MPPPFIHDDFLLPTPAARKLYHEYARDEPIFDYHCHLPPAQIASNHRFNDLADIWLGGDHYKWRAMRANGVAERFCTGDATPREKFDAWCATLPHTLGNPLYHWSHLELTRYFGITDQINPSTADVIWEQANARLSNMRVHDILKANKVSVICTTDDPADALTEHARIAASDLPTKVYPTFRPDGALRVDQPAAFNAWLDRLATTAGLEIKSFDDLLAALHARHGAFHEIGGRLSDHGLAQALSDPCSAAEAARIFLAARRGHAADPIATAQFGALLMLEFGRWDAARGWTKQLHLGAMRNTSTRQFRRHGADTGFDSIGDLPQVEALRRYFDALDTTDELPRTIIYNLNPADNYAFATLIGCFQDGRTAGKMQFGSGWWHLDQKQAMEWQLSALANLGLLSRFVGMLTDSRSFLSYTRHEYFRRVLCGYLGSQIDAGELPADFDLVGNMVSGICYRNAKNYFGLQVG